MERDRSKDAKVTIDGRGGGGRRLLVKKSSNIFAKSQAKVG